MSLLERAAVAAAAVPFSPNDPIQAMSCGLLDGHSLGLPYAVPFRYWQGNKAYLAGHRAGSTGNPSVICPLKDRADWAASFAEPTPFRIDLTYIDGASATVYVDENFSIDSLIADPTISEFTTFGF